MNTVIFNRLLFVLCLALPFTGHAKSLPDIETLLKESKLANWDKAISVSIIIKASVKDVWNYASDSTKAQEWSVFFDHISPLPGITDGKVGALRRCFRLADESGPRWDEVTTEVIPYQFRQITTYNLKKIGFASIVKSDYVFVRQIYRAIDKDTTEMTFQTQIPPNSKMRTKLAFYFSSKDTTRIFAENLENIRAAIEGLPRPYPWY